MALEATETLIELVPVDADLLLIIMSLCNSKVASVRKTADTVFGLVVFKRGFDISPNYWDFLDLSIDCLASGKEVIRPVQALYDFNAQQRDQFMKLFTERFRLSCLADGNESDGPTLVDMGNIFVFARMINCLGTESIGEFVDRVLDHIGTTGKLENGNQKAFAEFAFACLSVSPKFDASWWPTLKKTILNCWTSLPLEQAPFWSMLSGVPLYSRSEYIELVHQFFRTAIESHSSVSVVVALKILNSISREFGSLMWEKSDLKDDDILSLFAHEYSAIGTEASRLLAFKAFATNGQIDFKLGDSSKLASNPGYCRSILQFLAFTATVPVFTGFWTRFSELMHHLLSIMLIDNFQLQVDTKKALISLILSRRCNIQFVNFFITYLTGHLVEFPPKTRKFILELLQLCIQNNYFLLGKEDDLQGVLKAVCNSFLKSDLSDVREASLGIVLTLYQLSQAQAARDAPEMTRVLERLIPQIKTDNSLSLRHSTVIRSCAIVLAEPYSISLHLPALLSALSRFISDKNPIGPLVKTTFSEFRRTHMETWAQDRQFFTNDQLDAIGELLVAPSYYA